MLNNHFFKTQILLAALAAAIVAPVFAFAQQKPAAKTIQDSDIYVPEKVLEPSYTKKEAADLLKEYIAAFGDSDMPRSYKEFAKEPNKFKRIGTRQLQSALGNLYNYIFDASVKEENSGRIPVSPELMEVTEASDAWFRELYNKALELNEPAALMDKAISMKNASLYTQAAKGYAEKYDELQKFFKKGPRRLDAAKLKQITDANRARRRTEYIAQRKKQLQEQDAAIQQSLQEEQKKGSSSKK